MSTPPSSYRGFSPLERRQARRKSLWKGKALLMMVCGVLTGGFIMHSQSASKEAVPTSTSSPTESPISETKASIASTPSGKASIPQPRVQKVLEQIVNDNPEIIFGISYTNLTTGEHADVQGDDPFIAASTTKVLTACLYLTKVQEGSLNLDARLGSYTGRYQLEQMVNQSNNDSWALFHDLLGLDNQEQYAHQIGLNSYKSAGNYLSANDMTTLLSKLYKGELLNQTYTDLLLSYMQDTHEESFIPTSLPAGTTHYHKVGQLEDNVHDAAIIKKGDQTFVLSIYSNGQGYYRYDERAELFHQIVSKVINLVEG